jgi:hypothetical protein
MNKRSFIKMATYNLDPNIQIRNLAFKIGTVEAENSRLTAIIQDFSRQIDEYEKKYGKIDKPSDSNKKEK